jgi:hypothetical protein
MTCGEVDKLYSYYRIYFLKKNKIKKQDWPTWRFTGVAELCVSLPPKKLRISVGILTFIQNKQENNNMIWNYDQGQQTTGGSFPVSCITTRSSKRKREGDSETYIGCSVPELNLKCLVRWSQAYPLSFYAKTSTRSMYIPIIGILEWNRISNSDWPLT